MKNASFSHSLIWRLSLALMLLLILLGVSYVLITATSARKYYQETTQRLNANVAEHMLLEVQPFVNGEVNEEALGKIMHSMMAVNPSLEVYLLDPTGQILSYVVLDKKVRLKNVNIEPVREFIRQEGTTFVLGDDPRQPGNETVFSATRVEENGELLGYVYMVLASEKYEHIAGALVTSYFMRVGTTAFLLTLVGALLIGILLIYWLTRNLRVIIQTVKQFSDGDYHARIPVTRNDELAAVGRTFNHMADTLVRNMDELKQVDRLRRELIANVSHDLRSPMSVIHGYIETLLLKEGKLTPEERQKYLGIVLRSSEKLKQLVADLFELSRLESQQVEVHKEAFSLHEYMQRTAEEYTLAAHQKAVNIEVDIPAGLPAVYADVTLMQRVIQNLLDNAVKYTPENGVIRVAAEVEANKVAVSIANSGPGIPEQDIPHLFDRYYKLGRDQQNRNGAGLGLAIVKKILDIHEAIIRVTSKREEWTTFRFSLPVS